MTESTDTKRNEEKMEIDSTAILLMVSRVHSVCTEFLDDIYLDMSSKNDDTLVNVEKSHKAAFALYLFGASTVYAKICRRCDDANVIQRGYIQVIYAFSRPIFMDIKKFFDYISQDGGSYTNWSKEVYSIVKEYGVDKAIYNKYIDKIIDIAYSNNNCLIPANKEPSPQFAETEPEPDLEKLIIGNSYKNTDIAKIFHVATQGGMRKSNTFNSLILISKHDSSNPYEDHWEDGEIKYTGMGKIGNQSIDYRYNKTLANSKKTGTKVYYFESYENGEYIYQGRVELSGEPYYEVQKGDDGMPRVVVKFPLKMVD